MQFRSVSTDKALWEMDGYDFLRDGIAFEVKDVATVQQLPFCDIFSKYTGWSFEKKANVVTFTPPPQKPSERFHVRASAETLKLRCRVYEQQKKWPELHAFAMASLSLEQLDPELLAHAAWAEHKMQRTHEGWLFLQLYIKQYGNNSEFAYRVACLCAALNQIDDARQWLQSAFANNKQAQALKERALTEGELEKLWLEIEGY